MKAYEEQYIKFIYRKDTVNEATFYFIGFNFIFYFLHP